MSGGSRYVRSDPTWGHTTSISQKYAFLNATGSAAEHWSGYFWCFLSWTGFAGEKPWACLDRLPTKSGSVPPWRRQFWHGIDARLNLLVLHSCYWLEGDCLPFSGLIIV